MQQYYALDKKGTIILSAGRAGSHLLADILHRHLKNVTAVRNLGEVFFTKGTSLNTVELLQCMDELNTVENYVILQVQDFVTQLQILRFAPNWMQQYHVVHLTRDNLMAQFFGLQILHNFHESVPVHTIDSINDSFDTLKDKKIIITRDSVYQFFAHLEILKLFKHDISVTYEDLIQFNSLSQSQYKKNQYPVGPQELFENYHQIQEWLYGQD